MRLLFLTHNCQGLGGTYVRAVSLGAALAAAGHEVTLLTGRRVSGFGVAVQQIDGVQVVAMPDALPRRIRHGGLSPLDIAGRLGWAYCHPYDVVHGFDHRPAVDLPARLQRARFGALYVSDWADLWGRDGFASMRSLLLRETLGRADAWGEQRRLHHADAVTVISHDLAARARAAGVTPTRMAYVPAGANVEQIQPMPPAAARAKLGLATDALYLAYIGFSHHDAPLLVETLARLHGRGCRPHLITAGSGLEDLSRGLQAVGLAGFHHPQGVIPQPELGPILAAADLCMLPYADIAINQARFPQRFGDYLAAGRPIVTNPTGDLAEIVQREDIGAVAAAEPEAYAAATAALLNAPAQRAEMGRRARRVAETTFSWRALAVTVMCFYAELLGRRLQNHGTRRGHSSSSGAVG